MSWEGQEEWKIQFAERIVVGIEDFDRVSNEENHKEVKNFSALHFMDSDPSVPILELNTAIKLFLEQLKSEILSKNSTILCFPSTRLFINPISFKFISLKELDATVLVANFGYLCT